MDDLSGLKKAFNDGDMQVVSFIELLLADQPTGRPIEQPTDEFEGS